jgi:hypothetical protein
MKYCQTEIDTTAILTCFKIIYLPTKPKTYVYEHKYIYMEQTKQTQTQKQKLHL